ncbi:hypothetical protein IMZ48_38990 [Candidatus Bathyarchaeota archaeon]|nr:hypothetical protein [Candidatus Bathyarchaeota archaeon]
MVLPELDLSACGPSTLVDKINAVPALKTSTGRPPPIFLRHLWSFLPSRPPVRLLWGWTRSRAGFVSSLVRGSTA